MSHIEYMEVQRAWDISRCGEMDHGRCISKQIYTVCLDPSRSVLTAWWLVVCMYLKVCDKEVGKGYTSRSSVMPLHPNHCSSDIRTTRWLNCLSALLKYLGWSTNIYSGGGKSAYSINTRLMISFSQPIKTVIWHRGSFFSVTKYLGV